MKRNLIALVLIASLVGLGGGYGLGYAIYRPELLGLESDLSSQQSDLSSLSAGYYALNSTYDELKTSYKDLNRTLWQAIARARPYDYEGMYWSFKGESMEGFCVNDTTKQYVEGSGLTIATGGTTGDQQFAIKVNSFSPMRPLTWDKPRRVRFDAYAIAIDTTDCRIGLGNPINLTSEHAVFRVVGQNDPNNAKLYVSVADGKEQNQLEIGTIDTDEIVQFEIVVNPNASIQFLMNGILVATLTENLPAGIMNADVMFAVVISTTTNLIMQENICNIEFIQEP
jgi:hypothetical protein